MLLLASTSDLVRVVTSAAVAVDVHASFVDINGTTVTPGRTNTAISTATTTTVVGSPGASTYRNVKQLRIRNRSAASAVDVTVQHTDGSTSVELEKRTLGPGQVLSFDENAGWTFSGSSGIQSRPWFGLVAGAYGDGSPDYMFRHMQRDQNIAATPTNITTSVARCCFFRLPFDLTVNKIRFFGVGVTTNVYRVAIYRHSDLARLTSEIAITTAVDTWGAAGSALGLALAKDVLYFIAVAVNATGTTAGLACVGDTLAASTGQINTAPGSLPGNLSPGAGAIGGYAFQFAVTTGALPDPAANPVAQAAWTGGMPAFFLDANNA